MFHIEDEEAIVTAVHPDSQIEIEYLHASTAGDAQALDLVSRKS